MPGPIRVYTVVLMLLVTMGCRPEERVPGTPVATVGEKQFMLEDLDRMIPQELSSHVSARQKRDLVERWMEEELLYQEALRRAIDEEPEVRELIEKSRRELLVAQLMEREIGVDLDVTEEEILEYYAAHKEEFKRSETEIRARQILVVTSRKAEEIRNRLRKGERFETLAQQESLDSSALDGGDMGYFSEAISEPSFWSVCQNLKAGTTSRPARTDFGYHIIEVLDRKSAGTIRDLEQVRPELITRIATQKQKALLDGLLQSLRATIPYEIREDLLGSVEADSVGFGADRGTLR